MNTDNTSANEAKDNNLADETINEIAGGSFSVWSRGIPKVIVTDKAGEQASGTQGPLKDGYSGAAFC